MGWEQGIIESIIISCGIGMACDFSAHLGFAYRQANLQGLANSRAGLVGVAIERMAPALSAAAFSTGAMGFLMYFAGTLFTQRFGIFICLLMVFGWLFGFAFLLPLLSLIGPRGTVGEVAPCLFDYTAAKAPSGKVELTSMTPDMGASMGVSYSPQVDTKFAGGSRSRVSPNLSYSANA